MWEGTGFMPEGPLSRLPVSEGGPWYDPPVRDAFLCKSLSLFSSLIESISKF